MAQERSEPDLTSKLRESGEAAAHLAGRLRRILDDPKLSTETADRLLLGINTRCAEIEDLRQAITRSDACGELTRRLSHQIENLWKDMSKMASATIRGKDS